MKYAFPVGFEDAPSPYQPIAKDSYCGETVAWGHKLVITLNADRFDELRRVSNIQYIEGGGWCVVIRTLTRAEAIELYGEITVEDFGPRGGWRSSTFGKKTFISKYMRPEK